MKRIFIWFGLASLTVAAAAASCSINHRSTQFECDVQQDCDPGRTCSDGLCVTPGGDGGLKDGAIDGGPACPPQCTSCGPNKLCIIDCAAGANCGSQVTCPTGFNCDIRCTGDNNCSNGINCTTAASCTLQCTGRGSCRTISCGAGACNVNCAGQNSCGTVTCGLSCACDVKCPFANGACTNVLCNLVQCDTGRGCSSTLFPSCNTCP